MQPNDAQNVPCFPDVDIHDFLAASELAAEQDELNQYLIEDKDAPECQGVPSDAMEVKVETSLYIFPDGCGDVCKEGEEDSVPNSPFASESPDGRELLSPTISNLQFLDFAEYVKAYDTRLQNSTDYNEDVSYKSVPPSPTESTLDNDDPDDNCAELGSNADYSDLGEQSQIISDDELITLTVRELNKRLKLVGREDQKILKQRRRLLKNRGYAQTCRSRRIQEQKNLSHHNKSLQQTIKDLQNELIRVGRERDEYKEKLELMQLSHL